MRIIFALIPGLAAFATTVAHAAVPVDPGCELEIESGDIESYIGLSTAPPATVIKAHRGVIEVLDSKKKNKRLGYISKNFDDYRLLSYDPSIEQALVVTFTTGHPGHSTRLDLTPTNLNPPYPFLGLIQGVFNTGSNLAPGSFNYLLFGGISAPGTPPGAPPSNVGNSHNDVTGYNRTAESAVWTYDATSKALIPQWVNTDGSSPHEEFLVQVGELFIAGDKDAFLAKFPIGPIITIKFKFVPT